MYTNKMIVSHIDQSLDKDYQDLGFGRKSAGRNSKITVVVNPDYLDTYLEPDKTDAYSNYYANNYWLGMGFNIVGQYPVFGVNFNTSRCFTMDPTSQGISPRLLPSSATM